MQKNRKGAAAIIGIILAILVIAAVAYWMTKSTPQSAPTSQTNLNQQQIPPKTPIPEPTLTQQPTNTPNQPANKTVEVLIKNFAFSPSTITVSPGTTVTWRNQDSATHTVSSKNFNSGQIVNGASYQFTFNTPGTYSYHCSVHPSMTGQVIVK